MIQTVVVRYDETLTLTEVRAAADFQRGELIDASRMSERAGVGFLIARAAIATLTASQHLWTWAYRSMSYTRGAVAGAVSTVRVGVDIEYREDVDLRFFNRAFPEIDGRYMRAQDLFSLWTRKEAIVKASGRSLSDLPSTRADELWCQGLPVGDNYAATVAAVDICTLVHHQMVWETGGLCAVGSNVPSTQASTQLKT